MNRNNLVGRSLVFGMVVLFVGASLVPEISSQKNKNTKISILDSRGMSVENAKIVVSRDGKEVEDKSEEYGSYFSLPPGLYDVDVYYENELIGARKINVMGERSFDLITTQEPLFPLIVIIFSRCSFWL